MTVTLPIMSASISIDTAALITERSKRTWQRRLADGGVHRVSDDLRGRSMVRLMDVYPLVCVPLDEEDCKVLLQADGGAAGAQSDIAQVFDLLGKHEIAVYWWSRAAEQGDAEAMQCLGIAHAAGRGVPRDQNLALMWIARAAAQGHAIARAQVNGLLPRTA